MAVVHAMRPEAANNTTSANGRDERITTSISEGSGFLVPAGVTGRCPRGMVGPVGNVFLQ
jgi:hypothetical protein